MNFVSKIYLPGDEYIGESIRIPEGKAVFSNINHMSLTTVNFVNDSPLKIVVCSFESVKQLPSVQNDSPVMNTLSQKQSRFLRV